LSESSLFSIFSKEKDFFSSPTGPDRLWGPPSLFPKDTGISSPGVAWPGCKAYHSSPSSAEVKNAWNCTTTPPIRLHEAQGLYYRLP